MAVERFEPTEPRQEGKKFTYNPDDTHLWENLPRARLLRVSPRGHDAMQVETPPRNRSMVIALGTRQQIVIAFPYGNSELEGFHDHSEAWAISRLGTLNTWTVLHGSITLTQSEGEKKRTVFVYEASKDDKGIIEKHGGQFDQGKVNPLKYMPGCEYIPERIMQRLSAKELRVVEGISSASLYGLVKNGRTKNA